jgi:phosphodiesterase/alkaline phosphatase D-like protein
MAEALRTKAGPWCGAVTDASATIRATLLKSVTNVRLILATDDALKTGRMIFNARSIVSLSHSNYKPKIATFRAEGLTADTQYHYALEIDGVLGDALPGRFRTFPTAGSPTGFRFAVASCSKPKLFGGSRPEAYTAICKEKD